MANSVWCVRPTETAPIDLTWTDPDTGIQHTFWVKLKKRLTVGETKTIQTSGWTGVRPKSDGAEIGLNWREQGFTRMTVWVTSWSLADENKTPLPVSRDVMESLHPDVFALIENAITQHIEALDDEKKAMTGVAG